jgi:hypothetical protein
MRQLRHLTATVVVVLLTGIAALRGQWVNVPNTAPKTKDGYVDLAAAAPVAADGNSDLSGIWAIDAKGFSEGLADYTAGGLPMQQWAEAVVSGRGSNGGAATPTARCLPPGIPMNLLSTIVHPLKIVQQPSLIVILYEYFGEFRQIFLDGRRPEKDPNPTWLGYSIGRWDGKDLIVDSSGFNGKIWLDTAGHPATDALHITERFQRRNYGHLTVRMTIDDPQAYRKPWTVMINMHLVTAGDLLEYVCNENEKDARHSR